METSEYKLSIPASRMTECLRSFESGVREYDRMHYRLGQFVYTWFSMNQLLSEENRRLADSIYEVRTLSDLHKYITIDYQN